MKSLLLHLVLAAAIAHPLTAAPAAPRPNILYFYVDDMGWGSIGPNGQAQRRAKNLPAVLTSNIDRLAAEGVNFSRGYGCHVCSPARSSQQTGYQYINAGETYITDAGPPQLSWTATMSNSGDKPNTARADANLQLLSLELSGKTRSAPQTLVIGPGSTLTGRNEIRLAAHAILTMNQATVSSLRWVDVRPDAMLKGSGTVDAYLYNAGTVSCPGPLAVNRDYRESAGSRLDLTLSGGEAGLQVRGEATLAGSLAATLAPGFTPPKGAVFKIISSGKITGSFANPDHQVTAPGGTRFRISYTANAVTLTAM
jgi:hypothetical protein